MNTSPQLFTPRSAFTLIELMVVVLLIGIMSAVILPEMAGTHADAKLKSTARRLIALCGLASSQAISHNQTQRIRFDPPARRYRLENIASTSGQRATASRSAVGDVETEGAWDSSISLRIQEGSPGVSDGDGEAAADPGLARKEPAVRRGEPDALVFHGDGTAAARFVAIEDAAGFRIVLEINPTTSRVRIAAPPRP